CCGFDSVPHDLGAYFTVKQLPEDVPLKVEGFVRTANAYFSGGTYHSAVNAFGRARPTFAAARERGKAEPRPAGRKVHSAPARVRRSSEFDGWTAPLPTVDPTIVRRSAAAVDRYGPDFTYGHNLVARHLATIGGIAAGVGSVAVLSPIPPVRKLLLKAKSPGEGPDERKRAGAWFKVRFVGEGGGKRVVTEVSGGDPGYSETSKMLAECGLCLAFDDLPETAGQLTTVASMGDMLLTRLQNAGIAFRVLS
ncbi:MAG: saccharopine dehydrogenase, partial [Actinobacteria bacterium]|nr:saccharopine dehydrogenase [Actinomycetota bacterium]